MPVSLNLTSFLPSETISPRTSLENSTFVGIDFGTSTTVVSVASMGANGRITVHPLELNQKLSDGSILTSFKVPTIFAWYNNGPLIGEGAKELKYKLRKDVNLWHSFKMDLGEDVGCKYPNSELGASLKWKVCNPVDVTAIFFKYLTVQINKIVQKNNLPSEIHYAVSIPASFEANQRRDLLRSMEINEISISQQSLIDEPNAAFLSYVLSSEGSSEPIILSDNYRPNVLVFDFGAGTCDISILEIGQDLNGVYSKNIAISQFEKLGGDNIDRLIAIDVLLPQLLQGSGLTTDSFRIRELDEGIIPMLMAAAERLKVMTCERLMLEIGGAKNEGVFEAESFASITKEIKIDTRHGELSMDKSTLTRKEFAAVMNAFTSLVGLKPYKRIEDEYSFPSIFTPVNSALKKANMKVDDIDYVLYVGGSAKNPFVQNAINNYFPQADKIVPQDLQAHVSAGAAIHSLVYNGLGKNIIQPITSEPVMLLTKTSAGETAEPIIEAGTMIPSQIKVLDNLSPQRDGQEVVEMPVCVGSVRKMLYNIKLFAPDPGGFKISDKIKLELEINADKVLLIRASSKGVNVMVEPLSPFSNSEMTTEQRARFKAERDFNLEVAKNGGQPTSNSLKHLAKVYSDIGLSFKAAETLEMLHEMYPGKTSLNNIAVQYSDAGKKEKAVRFYEESMRKSPDSTVAFNLAMQYKYLDQDKRVKYLEQSIDLDFNETAAYELGTVRRKDGKEQEALELMEKAFDKWEHRFKAGKLQPWDYGWFSSCARALGKHDYAMLIEESAPKESDNRLYESGNLTQMGSDYGVTLKK